MVCHMKKRTGNIAMDMIEDSTPRLNMVLNLQVFLSTIYCIKYLVAALYEAVLSIGALRFQEIRTIKTLAFRCKKFAISSGL